MTAFDRAAAERLGVDKSDGQDALFGGAGAAAEPALPAARVEDGATVLRLLADSSATDLSSGAHAAEEPGCGRACGPSGRR